MELYKRANSPYCWTVFGLTVAFTASPLDSGTQTRREGRSTKRELRVLLTI